MGGGTAAGVTEATATRTVEADEVTGGPDGGAPFAVALLLIDAEPISACLSV